MPLSAGQIVNGKYKVIRALGDGGMGSVYEAHHEMLGTRVALKLLHAEFSRTGLAKRFLQEARASARIRSPHVVGVSDADQTPDGQAFIVLEYVEGKTLRELYVELARDNRSLTYDEALEYAMQMFEGVEAAHAAGIVHRDLKPDNVMITQDSKGNVLLKLLDFGIAKVDEPPESAGPALTRPGALLGTPEYMAPEQVYSAGSADVRSDVFALGVIIFEMLTGRRPVLSDDPQQIAVSYLTGAFTRLDEACPDAPPGLAIAIHRAFAAQPRDRFASVAEMRNAIEPFAPPRPASTARVTQLAPATSADPSRALPPKASVNNGARNIPDTRKYVATPDAPAPSPSAMPPRSSLPSTPAGTHLMPASPLSTSPVFQPDYPSAIAPSAVLPARQQSSSSYPPEPGFVPDRVSIVEPSSRLPYGPPQPQAGFAPAAAPPRRHRNLIYAGVAVALLVIGSLITIGILYELGWFDPDPPPKTHKPRPHPTHTAPAPTSRGGALR